MLKAKGYSILPAASSLIITIVWMTLFASCSKEQEKGGGFLNNIFRPFNDNVVKPFNDNIIKPFNDNIVKPTHQYAQEKVSQAKEAAHEARRVFSDNPHNYVNKWMEDNKEDADFFHVESEAERVKVYKGECIFQNYPKGVETQRIANADKDHRKEILVNRKAIADLFEKSNPKTEKLLCIQLKTADGIILTEVNKNWEEIQKHVGIQVPKITKKPDKREQTFQLVIEPVDYVGRVGRVEFYGGECIKGPMSPNLNPHLLSHEIHQTPHPPNTFASVNGVPGVFSVTRTAIKGVLEAARELALEQAQLHERKASIHSSQAKDQVKKPIPTNHLCIRVFAKGYDHLLAQVSEKWEDIKGPGMLTIHVLNNQEEERERRENEANDKKDSEQKVLVEKIVTDPKFAEKLTDASEKAFANLVVIKEKVEGGVKTSKVLLPEFLEKLSKDVDQQHAGLQEHITSQQTAMSAKMESMESSLNTIQLNALKATHIDGIKLEIDNIKATLEGITTMLGGPDTKGSLMHQLGNSLNEFKQSFDHTLKEHATKQEAVTHKIYELLLILSAKYCTNSSCDKVLRGLFNKIFDEYCTNANCDARIKKVSDGLKKELEAA